MTQRDVTPLQGDPLAEMSMIEWAYDMIGQLAKMSDRVARRTWNEMNDEEREALSQVKRDLTPILFARLDYIAAGHCNPSAVAA